VTVSVGRNERIVPERARGLSPWEALAAALTVCPGPQRPRARGKQWLRLLPYVLDLRVHESVDPDVRQCQRESPVSYYGLLYFQRVEGRYPVLAVACNGPCGMCIVSITVFLCAKSDPEMNMGFVREQG
jgi:hypothetical protein